jgi:hypothetical protein
MRDYNNLLLEPHDDDNASDVSFPTGAPIETLQRHVQTPIQDPIFADFVKQYGLTEYLELFKKAAILVQNDVPVKQIPNITATELQALELESDQKWKQPKTLYFTIMVCSIGAIEQGWAQASMNGANLYFPKEFGIGSSDFKGTLLVGLINSAIYLSTALM